MSSFTYKQLFLFLLLPMAISLTAANDQSKKKKEMPNIPLYQGIQLGVDMASPVKSLFSDSYGAAIKADVNLKNKYFPTLEIGSAHTDKTNENGTHFTSTGNYIKLGINKALSYRGSKAENLFFAGAHYGFTSFSYNLDNLYFFQKYWGNDLTNFQNEKAVAGWVELVAGVRIQVLGPVSMGWTVQYKSTLHVSNGENSIPSYIPGYGENVKPNGGIALHLYYKLPF